MSFPVDFFAISIPSPGKSTLQIVPYPVYTLQQLGGLSYEKHGYWEADAVFCPCYIPLMLYSSHAID